MKRDPNQREAPKRDAALTEAIPVWPGLPK